jgi:hypothetical protein
MLPPFDLFKIDTDGTTRWLEAAETLDAAKTQVNELLKLHPTAEYMIFSQQTQNRICVKAGDIRLIFKTEAPPESL